VELNPPDTAILSHMTDAGQHTLEWSFPEVALGIYDLIMVFSINNNKNVLQRVLWGFS